MSKIDNHQGRMKIPKKIKTPAIVLEVFEPILIRKYLLEF